jgi:hypothetical protein
LNKTNAKRFAGVERSFPEFFITMADALRQSFCIVTHRLFDKRTDVKSLVALIDDLKPGNSSVAARLENRINAEQTIIR